MARKKRPKEPEKDAAATQRALMIPGQVLDLYNDEGSFTVDAMNAAKQVLAARKLRNVETFGVYSDQVNNAPMHGFESPIFQHLFGASAIPARTLGLIIGDKVTAKTTMALTLAGQIMGNVPSMLFYYACGILPPPDEEYVKRCLSTDKKLAENMFNKATVLSRVHSLDQWAETLQTHIQTTRGVGTKVASRVRSLPINQPIIVVVDNWTSLASPTEATGIQVYAHNMEPKSLEDRRKTDILAAGANFEHSKHAHRVARMLGPLLHDYNVTMIMTMAQRPEVEFEMSYGPRKSKLEKALHNDNTLGGNGFSDIAAWQMICAVDGDPRPSIIVPGMLKQTIHTRMFSGPHGCGGRRMKFECYDQYPWDTSEYQSPPLNGARFFLELAAGTGHLGEITTDPKTENVSCNLLRQVDVSPEMLLFHLRYNHAVLFNKICTDLRIHGYVGGQ